VLEPNAYKSFVWSKLYKRTLSKRWLIRGPGIIKVYFICKTCRKKSYSWSSLVPPEYPYDGEGVIVDNKYVVKMKKIGMSAHKLLNPDYDIRWNDEEMKDLIEVLTPAPEECLIETCLNCDNLGYEGSEGEYGVFCYAKKLPEDQQPTRSETWKIMMSHGDPDEKLSYMVVNPHEQKKCIWDPPEFIPHRNFVPEVWTSEYERRRKRQITERFGVKHVDDE